MSVREMQTYRTDGKNHYTDQSTDAALNAFNAAAADGEIDEHEMLAFLEASMDMDQVTNREYTAMRHHIEANLGKLSPEARKMWEKFDIAMQTAGGNHAHKHHSADEHVLMSGANALGVLEQSKIAGGLAKAPEPQPDKVETPPANKDAPPPASASPPPPPPPANKDAPPPSNASGTGGASGASGANEGEDVGTEGYSIETLNNMEKGIKPDFMTDRQWANFQLQQAMQERQEMVTLMTQLLKMRHEMNMSIVRNISA